MDLGRVGGNAQRSHAAEFDGYLWTLVPQSVAFWASRNLTAARLELTRGIPPRKQELSPLERITTLRLPDWPPEEE